MPSSADLRQFVRASSGFRLTGHWNHGAAKAQCGRVFARQNAPAFSSAILTFADTLVTMQGLRLDADYNPGLTFYRSAVQVQVTVSEQALEGFLATPRADRKAFAAFVMHRGRGN